MMAMPVAMPRRSGKPLHQRRHRRDVAEAETDAADHAGAEPQQPELMGVDADRAEEETAAPAQRRDEAGLARARRARASRPTPPPRCRARTKNSVYIQPMLATFQSQVVVNSSCDQRHVGARPSARSARVARDSGSQNTAEAVGHADAQMDAQCRRRHQPAIEAGGRDRRVRDRESRSSTGMPVLMNGIGSRHLQHHLQSAALPAHPV